MSETLPQRLPCTRAELMMLVEASWTELWTTIDGLDEHQMIQPSLDGGWSIKDQLAHLAIWTNSASALLSGNSRRDAVQIAPGHWESGDEAQINDAIVEYWRSRSAIEVIKLLHGAQDELRSVVSGMTDDDLARPYGYFQPGKSSAPDEPVIRWIIGSTYEHIGLHLPAIRRLRSVHA